MAGSPAEAKLPRWGSCVTADRCPRGLSVWFPRSSTSLPGCSCPSSSASCSLVRRDALRELRGQRLRLRRVRVRHVRKPATPCGPSTTRSSRRSPGRAWGRLPRDARDSDGPGHARGHVRGDLRRRARRRLHRPRDVQEALRESRPGVMRQADAGAPRILGGPRRKGSNRPRPAHAHGGARRRVGNGLHGQIFGESSIDFGYLKITEVARQLARLVENELRCSEAFATRFV